MIISISARYRYDKKIDKYGYVFRACVNSISPEEAVKTGIMCYFYFSPTKKLPKRFANRGVNFKSRRDLIRILKNNFNIKKARTGYKADLFELEV